MGAATAPTGLEDVDTIALHGSAARAVRSVILKGAAEIAVPGVS